jgi:hypothetical protein
MVVSGLGFTIFIMLKRKSQFSVAQIHSHITRQLFKSVSISSMDVSLQLMVGIKVGKYWKIRLVVYLYIFVHCLYATPCINHFLSFTL